MDADQLKKLRQFYHSLVGQQRIFDSMSASAVEARAILPLEDELHQLNQQFPQLMTTFDKGNYFLHSIKGDVYYTLIGIRAYVAMAIGRLQIAIDQSSDTPVTEKRQFTYVKDLDLRTIIERDYDEMQRAYISRCWKSVIILCGGAIEAILTDLLKSNETAAKASLLSRKRLYNMPTCRG